MMDETTYAFKGFIRALGEGFCYNILLPIWYVFIKIGKYINGSEQYK